LILRLSWKREFAFYDRLLFSGGTLLQKKLILISLLAHSKFCKYLGNPKMVKLIHLLHGGTEHEIKSFVNRNWLNPFGSFIVPNI